MATTQDPKQLAQELQHAWDNDPRWANIQRNYTAEEAIRLRGSIQIDYPLARLGAERLWQLMNNDPFVRALGAVTGNQAVQMVQAGLQAVYVSGWQTAADNNTSGHMYPDQSLYPADGVPNLVRNINQALMRTDQIYWAENRNSIHWLAPLVADAEAGFGGVLNCYELMRAMIEAGAAGVHFEDQLASEKKCGHLGGKVLIPMQEFVRKLQAARLAADVMAIPSILIARTDAFSAKLLTNDIDERDHEFLTGERTFEGYYRIKENKGLEYCIARGLAYAPYADLIWWETSTPDLGQAREFAEAIHEKYPGKLLMYNCSPSFNWRKYLDDKELRHFQDKLGEMGYKFQFITLAGFHSLNEAMYRLALQYKQEGMLAYSNLQEKEFELERSDGYRAVKHQSFVGTGYFDLVQETLTEGQSSTAALKESTESQQF
jgi:isocitrate lyase